MIHNAKQYAVMVDGMSAPAMLHDNYEAAEAEAARLGRKERRTTYVLLAITKVELADVKITSLA